jgi:putative redox protein
LVFTMSVEVRVPVRQLSGATSEATVRTHRVLVDRPEAKGGNDAGAMGGELFVVAVAGCFMSNLIAALRARDIEVENLYTEAIGTADGTPLRYVSVDLIVHGDTPDREGLAHAVEIAERGCIMLNTLRGKIDSKITLAEPVAA